MRILLIADIHANRYALEAIQEPFDLCLCMGDLVEYGPDPKSIIEWIQSHRAVCVRGNHDHGTSQDVPIIGAGGFKYLTMATRPGTISKLELTQKRFLNQLPTTAMLTVDGKRILIVHATPRDPLDEYTAPTAESWESRLIGVDADFVLVGHTHQQFQLQIGRTNVVNPGAVGLPRDGDPKVRYAIIDNGNIELKSCDYPIEKTVASVMDDSTLDMRAKKMLIDVYRTGKLVHQPATANESATAVNR
jgi:putative phosphoesterase